MSACNYLETNILNLVLRGQAFTSPGEIFMALFTADPTDDPAGNAPTGEVTDSAYVRRTCGATPSSAFAAPSGGSTSNSNVITFPAIADAQVVVTHWCLYDDEGSSTPPVATEGNPLLHGELATPKTLDVSDVPSFPAGALTIQAS